MATPCIIDTLPSEVLSTILDLMPTSSLVPLASVSRRFYSAAQSVLYLRLLRAASLASREVILECYHPSAKLNTPYLSCPPLVPGRTEAELAGAYGIGELGKHYSRFRPALNDEDRRPRRRYPPTSQEPTPEPEINGMAVMKDKEPPTVDVNLDSCELFSQLVTVANVVTVGPRRGLFVGHVNIGDGVMRVWRDWLAARVGRDLDHLGEDEDVIWADVKKDVGVRFRVLEKHEPAMLQPLLLGPNEDPAVSYTLVYEELLIRTSKLMLAMEKSETEEVTHSAGAFYDPRGAVSLPSQTFFWAIPAIMSDAAKFLFTTTTIAAA